MSPRTSDWKSQGETRTMSPTRTQTLLFSFPLILQRRSWPSWHFTMTRSKPSSLTAMPRTSLATGNCILPKSSSLITFLLPNSLQPSSRGGCHDRLGVRQENHVSLRLCLGACTWTQLWFATGHLAVASWTSNSCLFFIWRNPDDAADCSALWAFNVVADVNYLLFPLSLCCLCMFLFCFVFSVCNELESRICIFYNLWLCRLLGYTILFSPWLMDWKRVQLPGRREPTG